MSEQTVDMDTVAREAGAALDAISKEWRSFGVGDEIEMTGYLKIGEEVIATENLGYDNAEFIENAPDWLRALLAEREQLIAIADAAREWTRIEHDADEVSMDEAIEICEQLQAATEKWMSDQQAALAALDAGKGEGG